MEGALKHTRARCGFQITLWPSKSGIRITVRLQQPAADPDLDPLDGPTSSSGSLLQQADVPRGAFGRPSPTPPPMGGGRHSGPQEGMQRQQNAMPGSMPLIPGLGDPLAEREVRSGSGLIDPD